MSLSCQKIANTPAHGAMRRSDSVKQAVALPSRLLLQPWLQALLYAEPDQPKQFVLLLTSMATTRGRLLERLMAKLHSHEQAPAYMPITIGIMSMLDALFGTAMAAVAMVALQEKFVVSGEFRQALLHRKGFCRVLFKIAESLEPPESHYNSVHITAQRDLTAP